jgi:hypothetical protein
MGDELDALMRRLTGQPVGSRLERLERDIVQSVTTTPAPQPVRAWRFASIAAALALGLGVGGSAAALRNQPALADDLTAGVRLAPSSLLDTSR